jgi:hypothetical protein
MSAFLSLIPFIAAIIQRRRMYRALVSALPAEFRAVGAASWRSI